MADAFSEISGTPPPGASHLVALCRKAAYRAKRPATRRAPPVFREELPPVPPETEDGPALGRQPGPTASRRLVAANRHMRVLSDALGRHDDLVEAQLGDVLHHPGQSAIAIFGRRPGKGTHKWSSRPSDDPGSGRAALVDSVRAGLARLLQVPREDLRAMTECFQRSNTDHCPVGLEALATWPPDIRDMASRLYEIGLPAHRLPLFGIWLFNEFSASIDLAAAVPTQTFCGMVKKVLAHVPGAPRAATAHSMRRGGRHVHVL